MKPLRLPPTRDVEREDRVALFLSNGVPYLEIVMALRADRVIAEPIITRSTIS